MKIELGCGNTKVDGFIGIDRFPLPNVDIVADINAGIPLENDSADVVFASHSLEHMNDFLFVMEEIYRVAKHKGLVLILAPYYFTTTNVTNFYHKIVFNEDTFRFFTDIASFQGLAPEEHECPHAQVWGLGQSDNSSLAMSIETLSIEYFYFEAYRDLPKIEQTHARRSLLNVCDMIYYVLAVNKSNEAFTKKEVEDLLGNSKSLEPERISALRKRDAIKGGGTSLLDDLGKAQEVRILEMLQELSQNTDQKIIKLSSELASQNKYLKEQTNRINMQQDELKKGNELLQQKLQFSNQVQQGITANVLDIIIANEKSNLLFGKFLLFRRKLSLYPTIHDLYQSFTDSLILQNNYFNQNSVLASSQTIPFTNYVEYQLAGFGGILHFFVFATKGSGLLVEVVADDQIIKQEVCKIDKEGPFELQIEQVVGNFYVRFQVLDNSSIVRVLEIQNRHFVVFAQRHLAGYII